MAPETRSSKKKGEDSKSKQVEMPTASWMGPRVPTAPATKGSENKDEDSQPKRIADPFMGPRGPLTWPFRTPEPILKPEPNPSRTPASFDPSKVNHTPRTPWGDTFSSYLKPDG